MIAVHRSSEDGRVPDLRFRPAFFILMKNTYRPHPGAFVHMRIYTKSAVIILVTTLLLVMVAQVMVSASIDDEVKSTEDREVAGAMTQLDNSFDYQMDLLNTVTGSYAYWNDSYDFMTNHNISYVDGNFNIQTVVGLGVNFILAFNSSMVLETGTAVDLDNGSGAVLDNGTIDSLTADAMILSTPTQPNAQNSVSGLMDLPGGVCMISSRPILRNDLSGPSDGYIIAGRYLDGSEIALISNLTDLPLSISRYSDPTEGAFIEAKIGLENGAAFLAVPMNDTTIAGYGVINDIHGQPVIILQTRLGRGEYQQGERDMTVLLFLFMIAGMIIAGVSLVLQQKMIFSRMDRLGREVKDIGSSGDTSSRLSVKGKDEVRSLADDVNAMLASLEKAEGDLKESEEKFRKLFNNVGDAILIHYPGGPYIEVNDAAVKRFGFSREELLTKYPQDLDASDQAVNVPKNMEMILKNGTATIRTINLTKTGELTPSEINARIVTWGGKNAILVVIRDLTERIEAEQNEMNNNVWTP